MDGWHAGLKDVGIGAVTAKASAALINAALGPKTRPVLFLHHSISTLSPVNECYSSRHQITNASLNADIAEDFDSDDSNAFVG